MERKSIHPFGLEIRATEPLLSLQDHVVRQWVASDRVVVLRGMPKPSDAQILEFCGKLGQILEWEFGAFNELKVDDAAKNYLYTNRAVPMHWDGAFVGRIPHLIFFYCQMASDIPDAGGETLFCDSIDLVASLNELEKSQLSTLEVKYSTDKVAHYGGSFTSPLIVPHPKTGQATLRYAEPVSDLNPVHLQVAGMSDEEQESLIVQLRQKLYEPSRCYAHKWRTGDIVIADNHALLHGRNAFRNSAPRHLRRVNVL